MASDGEDIKSGDDHMRDIKSLAYVHDERAILNSCFEAASFRIAKDLAMQLGAAGERAIERAMGDGNQALERIPKRKCCGRNLATTTKRERTYTRRWRGAMPGAYGTWHGCFPAWGVQHLAISGTQNKESEAAGRCNGERTIGEGDGNRAIGRVPKRQKLL
jgi:hypothetical protein